MVQISSEDVNSQQENVKLNVRSLSERPKIECTEHKLIRVSAGAFIVLAVIISVKGNLDVLSGKTTLDVIQGMIVQGIELILKANRIQKSIEESDRI